MKTILTTLAVAAALLSTSAADTGDSTRSTAANLMQRMAIDGYEVRSQYTFGDLNQGGCVGENTTLYAGVSYLIAVEGAGGATDVDVRIYDQNGNLIAADTDGTNVGVLRVTPRWTGRFRIFVTMADTLYGEGSYVTQIGSR